MAVLYSLPSEYHRSDISSTKAHDFLLQFQSRNIRRKLQTAIKKGDVISLEESDYGSTWMCCLALLAAISSGQNVDHAEALFAAQSLVHRLRRVKMYEAMDLELEPPVQLPDTRVSDMLLQYKEWIRNWQRSNPNGTLGVIFQQYEYSGNDEERLKCEITVLTLAALIMDISLAHPHLRPLVSTLSSALAVAAARMRYSPASMPQPAPATDPIVNTILSTFDKIRQVASPSLNLDETYRWVVYTCMTVLPDALLSGAQSGAGAYGSISMDPRCYKAVTMEVRTHGMRQVYQILNDASEPQLLFDLCQQWAKYAPLPLELLNVIVPMIRNVFFEPHHEELLKAAMRFWITIMESGSWSLEHVLASALLQKPSQQQNKKKQSNKAKKRQQEALQERTTEDHLAVAQAEVKYRQDIAVRVAHETINGIQKLVGLEVASVNDVDDEVSGEGPVGGIVACANTCLPFIVHSNSHPELFVSISSSIRELCNSPSRMLRNFGMETLYTLHESVASALAASTDLNQNLALALVEHLVECSMSLARGCAYPIDYFTESSMAQSNDDDLENERNDVRDILRTVSSVTCGSKGPSSSLSLEILRRLVKRCTDPILSPQDIHRIPSSTCLCHETDLHTFSALARPLISVSSIYRKDTTQGEDILQRALSALELAGRQLIGAFPLAPMAKSLPLSRLYNLAVASFSPMLSNLVGTGLQGQVIAALHVGVETAIVSLKYIPELVAFSTLRSSRHDIRGAMRTPGGEDHAAVLALMRLATQTDVMATTIVQSRSNVGSELCQVYKHLKQVEQQRGRGVHYGKGVLPKSRRILLSTICHLEHATNGAAGASSGLQEIFEESVNLIGSIGHQVDVESFFQATESTFDLAGFSPSIISRFFEAAHRSPNPTCVEVWTYLGCFGYIHITDSSIPGSIFVDWNRLRAALFCFLKASEGPDFPSVFVEAGLAWIQNECHAIDQQCQFGPTSTSNVFREELISEEAVPAGLVLHAICHFLKSNKDRPLHEFPNCMHMLCEFQHQVLDTISCLCSSPMKKGSFYDPRPMIAEIWLLNVTELMRRLVAESTTNDEPMSPEFRHAIQVLAMETCVTQLQLLLYPTLGKTQEARAHDPGMTTDSAHSLVAMELFLVAFLDLGPATLQAISKRILEKIALDLSSLQPYTNDPDGAIGVAVVVASLLRTCSGGLPPWAVECMPGIFASLYNATFGRNIESLVLSIQMAMHVRWSSSVRNGELLAGRFFSTMGEKHKTAFLEQVVEVAQINSPVGWKRMKTIIKTACGGKKKDTDFNQRPALTKLDDLDRV